MRTDLLVIDPQNSFCNVVRPSEQHTLHDGEMFVPGAPEAMQRLVALIERLGDAIDNIHITMDSRHLLHISHPLWFRDANGNPPPPFTIIRLEGEQIVGSRTGARKKQIDIGEFVGFRPSVNRRTVEYIQKLAEQNRYRQRIWPPHCLIGTAGHCIQADLMNAVLTWEAQQHAAVNYVTKGSNHFVEHFSAIAAAVPDPTDPSTGMNIGLLNTLMDADRILVAGVGRASSLADTLVDAASAFAGQPFARKCVLLEDCLSVDGSSRSHLKNAMEQLERLGMKTTASGSLGSHSV